jgi:hypothetical protein
VAQRLLLSLLVLPACGRRVAPWFTDEIAELGTKDAEKQLRGV